MKKLGLVLLICGLAAVLLAGCDGGGGPSPTTGTTGSYPQGRIVTADQGGDTLSVIDVATDKVVATVKTGSQPHHVLAGPDGKLLWVTLYKENRLQIFDAATLQPVGDVAVGGASDDLAFSPDGARLYVSLGSTDQVAVVDTAARKLLTTVAVGRTPHGVRVRPDDQELYVTNTAENTVSVLTLGDAPKMAVTFRVGTDPFEVMFSADSKFAYVSNFLGDSIGVIDTATRKITAVLRVGRQPATLAFVPGKDGELLWVANTGSQEVWVIDLATRQPVKRIPVGQGAHGVVPTPSGKVYVSNTNDSTVSVVDAAEMTVRATIGTGTRPNGLCFVQ